MTYPAKDNFDYNLSRKMYEYYSKDKHYVHDMDKDHPVYKYKYPNVLTGRIMSAALQNPLGSVWEMWVTFQGYGFCADVEMRAMNCLEAYGLPQSMNKCLDLLEDYYECYSGKKSEKRLEYMRAERNRQYASGERKFKYAVPPKIGVWLD